MNTSNDRTNNDSDNQHEPLWQRHLREEERQELIKYIQLAESSTKGLVSVEDDPGDPMHRFLRVVVRVTWDATHTEIRTATAKAMQLRDYLKEKTLLYIPAEDIYIRSSRETFLEMSGQKQSYSMIADYCNESIAYHLKEFQSQYPSPDLKDPQLVNRGDYYYAALEMQAWGFTRKRADTICTEMLKDADDLLMYIGKEFPITRNRVIDTLKRWRNSEDRVMYLRGIGRKPAVE